MTIFGLGSHSATGEQWTDDDNACTCAEAQAFKRACACFGLGRYLYHFAGAWVDLDERRRPKTTPQLPAWATPEGWRQGLRPNHGAGQQSSKPAIEPSTGAKSDIHSNARITPERHSELVRRIEAMAHCLGRGLYRGLLKDIAQVWQPGEVQDAMVLEKVLAHMLAAERGLERLSVAIEKGGAESLAVGLRSRNIKSLEHINNLDTLEAVIRSLEATAR